MVSLGVISLTEFYSLRFKDFVRLEAVHHFKNEMQTKAMNNKKQDKQETVSKLAGLPEVSIESLGLTPEQKELLDADN